MQKMTKFSCFLLIIATFSTSCAFTGQNGQNSAKTPQTLQNIVLFVGDGMGFEQIKAAGIYANGEAGKFKFESFPYQGQVTTYCADQPVTDSAAAGTAIATGKKVNNGVISLKIPGDNSELKTMLEHFQEHGKTTALISTAFISHATPAAFGAHEESRDNYNSIIQDYLTQTKPDILLGGAKYVTPAQAENTGYTVATDLKSLLEIDTDKTEMFWGQFGEDSMPYEFDGVGDLPHLSDMTRVALDIADNDPDGFFMMVEAGRIDHAGHDNSIEHNIFETIEFAKTIKETLEWAKGRKDTLIIVTADHETGGLQVTEAKGVKGEFPDVTWSTGGHTSVNVPVYAWGYAADQFTGVMDNTDFYLMITDPIVTTKVK
jgi:alkaline phosphatase